MADAVRLVETHDPPRLVSKLNDDTGGPSLLTHPPGMCMYISMPILL